MRTKNISDAALYEAVERAEKGLIDADLGDGVIKQRIAKKGKGKRSGFRTIIIIRSREYAFFIFGFAKSERGNIRRDEQTAIKNLAPILLELTEEGIDALIKDGSYMEVKQNGKTIQE